MTSIKKKTDTVGQFVPGGYKASMHVLSNLSLTRSKQSLFSSEQKIKESSLYVSQRSPPTP